MSQHFIFSQEIYSLATIKKAAIRFAGHYVVDIQSDKQTYVVTLSPMENVPFNAPPAESFPGEVLDQDLRALVANETRAITEVILAQAFSNLALTDPVAESAQLGEDPHHIASPDGSL